MARLKDRYRQEILPQLVKEFNFSNIMQAPRIVKVVVNVGVGEALTNAKALDATVEDITSITGQKPIITKARNPLPPSSCARVAPSASKSLCVAIGCGSSSTGCAMLRCPASVIFEVSSPDAFDGRGNYTLGLRNNWCGPRYPTTRLTKCVGMEISIVDDGHSDERRPPVVGTHRMPFRS